MPRSCSRLSAPARVSRYLGVGRAEVLVRPLRADPLPCVTFAGVEVPTKVSLQPLHLFVVSRLSWPRPHLTSLVPPSLVPCCNRDTFTSKASPSTGKMSFAIEVPGEASPLTMQELCKALEAATSMDNSQRQAAGKQLSTWETQQGYFPSLQVRSSAVVPDRVLLFLCLYSSRVLPEKAGSLTRLHLAEHLPRQVDPTRDPLPRHNTDQERN